MKKTLCDNLLINFKSMITPKPNTVIHVKTQEEYDELQKEMGESGFELLSKNWWPEYEERTCINIDIDDKNVLVFHQCLIINQKATQSKNIAQSLE